MPTVPQKWAVEEDVGDRFDFSAFTLVIIGAAHPLAVLVEPSVASAYLGEKTSLATRELVI